MPSSVTAAKVAHNPPGRGRLGCRLIKVRPSRPLMCWLVCSLRSNPRQTGAAAGSLPARVPANGARPAAAVPGAVDDRPQPALGLIVGKGKWLGEDRIALRIEADLAPHSNAGTVSLEESAVPVDGHVPKAGDPRHAARLAARPPAETDPQSFGSATAGTLAPGVAISPKSIWAAPAVILGDEEPTQAPYSRKRKPAPHSRSHYSSSEERRGVKLRSGTGKRAYAAPSLAPPFGWTFSTRCSTNEVANRGRRPGAKWPKTFK
jgi:hypothetical protein